MGGRSFFGELYASALLRIQVGDHVMIGALGPQKSKKSRACQLAIDELSQQSCGSEIIRQMEKVGEVTTCKISGMGLGKGHHSNKLKYQATRKIYFP